MSTYPRKIAARVAGLVAAWSLVALAPGPSFAGGWANVPERKRVRRSIAEAIRGLQRRPSLGRPVVGWLDRVRITGLVKLADALGGARPAEQTYVRQGQRVTGRLMQGGVAELGLGAQIGAVRVMNPPPSKAGRANATTAPDRTIVVDDGLCAVARQLGSAMALSSSPEALLDNIARVARGSFAPSGRADSRRASRYADAVLANVIGHEMTHAIKRDPHAGEPAAGNRRAVVAKELVADAGGMELAVRSGFTPLAAVVTQLYLSFHSAVTGSPGKTHPTVERYRTAYQVLDRMCERQPRRWIYDKGTRHLGRPYVSCSWKSDLALIPTRQQVEQRIGQLVTERQRAQ